jgi:hypothetical protein
MVQSNVRAVQWVGVGPNVTVLLGRPQSLETGVFYVGHLLGKFKVEDVTTAVQTAWAMGQNEANAELKYHQDTQLLIVRGPKAYLNVVKDVLSELKNALPGSPSTPPSNSN